MTYLLFVNEHYVEYTRNNSLAFSLWRDWTRRGWDAQLKFVKDGDEEAFQWLGNTKTLFPVVYGYRTSFSCKATRGTWAWSYLD